MCNNFCEIFFKVIFRGFSSVIFFSKFPYPSRLSSPTGLYSSNFLFLCIKNFPGDCLAPLSQHRNNFDTNPGKRTQKFGPKTFLIQRRNLLHDPKCIIGQ